MVVEPARRWLGRFGSLGSIVHLLLLTWAAVLASRPLRDNSFFTHLATGRIILDEWRVPTSDPYSFTAPGADWTVQSWLASATFAGAEQLAGRAGLHALFVLVFGLAMHLLWRLSAPAGSLVARVAVVGLALAVVSSVWAERPFMVGVIGLSVTWLALERRLPSWVLGPVLAVWVNAHGSFPMAVVLVALVVFGRWLDRRSDPSPERRPLVERGLLAWGIGGTLVGALHPLGPRLLLFPLTALRDSRSLDAIVEWQPPSFDAPSELAFLGLLATGLVAAARLGSWARLLPVVVFGLAGVVAQRNIAMAVVVLVPVLAESLPAFGTLRASTRPALGVVVAGSCTVVLALSALLATTADDEDLLGPYPTRALAWAAANLPAQDLVATQDFTGNLLTVLDGASGRVFVDDRADMYPFDVVDDYLTLLRGSPGWDEVLDRHGIDHVVWERSAPLSTYLGLRSDWQVRYSDSRWLVASRRDGTGS